MKKLILLTLLFICLSISAKIDPYIQPFVDQFVAEGMERGVILNTSKVLDIGFPNSTNQYIIDSLSLRDHKHKQWQGITWHYNDGMVSVYFNPELFFGYTELYRRLLIYHELAHALVLGNKHPANCRLMNHNVLNNIFIQNDIKTLLDEIYNYNITVR